MNILGIRFCSISQEAREFARTLESLGLVKKDFGSNDPADFQGAIFPVGPEKDTSWIEIWPQSEQMPVGVMLQIIVDDADAFAEHGKSKGLAIQGPIDAHGERIYFLKTAGGTRFSFQSKLKTTEDLEQDCLPAS